MLLPAIVAAIIISCDNEDAITYSGTDVTGRISALSSTAPGQGADLTITGSQMDEVLRVFVGNVVVTKNNFLSQDASAITFTVPPTSALGQNKLLVVWPGSATGSKAVDVVVFHTFSKIAPLAAATGQTVTLFGTNLNLVESVAANGVSASIVSKSSGVLKFTMPAGATTGPVSISSSAGVFTGSTDLIACESQPGNVGCLPVINTNGSFEAGELGTVGTISVPGWNLGGSRITSVITNEDAYEGSQCAKITINSIGGNPWDIQPTSNITVDPTATYHLSMWIKGSGIANVKFAVDENGVPGYAEWAAPQRAISTSEWVEVSYTFSPASEASGDQVGRFAISMSYSGNVGGVMYMDNLRVVKVE